MPIRRRDYASRAGHMVPRSQHISFNYPIGLAYLWCHSPPAGENTVLSEQKLQFGVVSTSGDGVGHCAFSSKEVGKLVKGRMYA